MGLNGDCTIVDQHLDKLFHEERIAISAHGEKTLERVWNRFKPLQEHICEISA
jgi:hypothetical protein